VLKKVLIANRGEIAVRIIRTCREMGIATVAVYSELDREALHVRMADEAYALGGETGGRELISNTPAILAAIDESGADSVHPGYRFYSENTDFARAITADGRGLHRASPRGYRRDGRQDQQPAGGRVGRRGGGAGALPGARVLRRGDHLRQRGRLAGGHQGGLRRWRRGMKVVNQPSEAQDAVESAQREAQAYFGRPEIYVERYLTWRATSRCKCSATMHGNAVWLGERDCSPQRPPPEAGRREPGRHFPDDIRQRMGEAAVLVSKACGYVNAGNRRVHVPRGASSTSWR